MATLTNQHNFIWYGICSYDETSPKTGLGTNESGDCSPFSLNDSGVKTAWYINESNQKKSWVQDAENNDFTELVCGNAYYISLNKDAESISSVEIPHAVISTENYKIAECEAPIDDSPLVIDNLWIAFARNDADITQHSDFYEVRGSEAETIRVDFDNLVFYNMMIPQCPNPPFNISDEDCAKPISTEGGGKFDATKQVPGDVKPYNSLPDGLEHANLHDAGISKDDDTGVVYVEVVSKFGYTKFEIIDDSFVNSIATEQQGSGGAFLSQISHIMLVKSDSKPTYGQDGYSDVLATAFNFPNEMVLKCGEIENYDISESEHGEDTAKKQATLTFNLGPAGLVKYNHTGEDDVFDVQQKTDGQDDKEWYGASNCFVSQGGGNDLGSGGKIPGNVVEFYFIRNDGETPSTKIEFGKFNRSLCNE